MTLTKAQKEVLRRLTDGESLCKKGSMHFLMKSNGMATKVSSKTFERLYWGRYIDTNGCIFHVYHYKISEKGMEAIKLSPSPQTQK